MTSRSARLIVAGILVATGLITGVLTSTAGASPPVTTITMQPAHAYTPEAPPGATDDYHCTLVNPHVKSNSFIVASQFYPNSIEVHHAILFLVPPGAGQAAQAADNGGKGWTCFGESRTARHRTRSISKTPWLTAWAPGHGKDVLPAGTGVKFPAGSLVVMQVHYNLLKGDKPVKAKLKLYTVPASTPLSRCRLEPHAGASRHPLPGGRDRTAVRPRRLAGQPGPAVRAQRRQFRQYPRDRLRTQPGRPSGGRHHLVQLGRAGWTDILRLGVHMHLLGRGMKIVSTRGPPSQDPVERDQLRLQLPALLHPQDPGGHQPRRHHRGHLHLRSDPRARAAPAPQGPAALRDLGGRFVRRDVPRAGADGVGHRAGVLFGAGWRRHDLTDPAGPA